MMTRAEIEIAQYEFFLRQSYTLPRALRAYVAPTDTRPKPKPVSAWAFLAHDADWWARRL
jgi:hypothetical protein